MQNHGFRFYLLFGFLVSIALLVLIGVYVINSFYQVQTRLNQAQKRADELLLTISQIDSAYTRQNLAWSNILIYGQQPEKYHRYLSAFYESERQTIAQSAKLNELLESNVLLQNQSEEFLEQLYKLRKNYRKALQIYNSSLESQQSTEEFLSVITEKPTAVLRDINVEVRHHHAETIAALTEQARTSELQIVGILIVVLSGIVVVLLWYVDRNFGKPMAQLITTAKRVEQGDLNERINLFASGEFGEFARIFNLMLDRLQQGNQKLRSTVTKLENEIDERERIERNLEAESRALAVANKELESFNYSVSHDLRAPLRSIGGFSRILEEDFSDALDDEGRNYLTRVRLAADRMGEIIDDLLELSGINRRPLNITQVDLSKMAAQVFADLKETEPDRQIEISISPGLVTDADAGLASIALVNLLGNAWKYTHANPEAKITFEATTENGQPAFRIQDNGVGFDMEFADKLFRPFERLHSNSEIEGTGIGLAIVERIMQRQGGYIRVQGDPGKGASFVFAFSGPGDPGSPTNPD